MMTCFLKSLKISMRKLRKGRMTQKTAFLRIIRPICVIRVKTFVSYYPSGFSIIQLLHASRLTHHGDLTVLR